jgi:hypothetical protein
VLCGSWWAIAPWPYSSAPPPPPMRLFGVALSQLSTGRASVYRGQNVTFEWATLLLGSYLVRRPDVFSEVLRGNLTVLAVCCSVNLINKLVQNRSRIVQNLSFNK